MGMATAHATGIGIGDGHAPFAPRAQHTATLFHIILHSATARVCRLGEEERIVHLESAVRIKRCRNVPCSGQTMEIKSPCCPYGM